MVPSSGLSGARVLSGGTESHTATTEQDGDASLRLFGDDFVVLIESKTGEATLDAGQMACHWQKIRPKRRDVKVVTWGEVHRFFITLSPGIHDAKSRWLVDQFTQLLEWTGMTDFVTPDREHLRPGWIFAQRKRIPKQVYSLDEVATAERSLVASGHFERIDPADGLYRVAGYNTEAVLLLPLPG
jgi:hypothetical protein